MRRAGIIGSLAVLLFASMAGAKPTIPEGDIPENIDPAVLHEIRGLYAQDPKTRGYAAYELVKLGSRAAPAVPFLVAMLGDSAVLGAEWLTEKRIPSEHSIFRRERRQRTSPGRLAADTLGKIGRSGLGLLLKALANGDETEREHAALALGGLKDKSSAPGLVDALDDPVEEVRERSAHALGRIASPKALERLTRLLKLDADVHVRKQAAWALGQIRDPRCIEPLMQALGDVVIVSSVAENALGEFRGPKVVDLAIKTLNHKSMRARKIAARILGTNEDRRAVPALIGALGDTVQVQLEALRALEAISGQSHGTFGPAPALWQHWWDLEVAGAKIHSLVVERDVAGLIHKLRTDKNWAVRERAALALSQYEDGRALEPLVDAMWDENLDVRVRAVWAVGALRDPRAVENLLEILKSIDKQLLEEAQLALQNITGERIMKADRSSWVRWWQKNKNRVYREAAMRPKKQRARAVSTHTTDDPAGDPVASTDEDTPAPPRSPGDGKTADLVLIVVGSLIAASFIGFIAAQALRKPKRKKRRRRKKR